MVTGVNRTNTAQNGYARLPADLLDEILTQVGRVTSEVEQMLGPMVDNRNELREALDTLGWVKMLDVGAPGTICGVDGGHAHRQTDYVDFLLAVAVGVEGFSGNNRPSPFWKKPQYRWWSHLMTRNPDRENLCRAVMAAQELDILRNAPHDYRILDGSHATPIIGLSMGLSSQDEEVRRAAAEEWKKLDTANALVKLANDPGIAAMPKNDSSRICAEELQKQAGVMVHTDDRSLMSLLLEPGEFLDPRPDERDVWTGVHLDSPSWPDPETTEAFSAAIYSLRQRNMYFTYFKPDERSPAYRIEIKKDLSTSGLEGLLATLRNQMATPFVREPYPQYLADRMAKSVGTGLSALHSAVQMNLVRHPHLADLFLEPHRSAGFR